MTESTEPSLIDPKPDQLMIARTLLGKIVSEKLAIHGVETPHPISVEYWKIGNNQSVADKLSVERIREDLSDASAFIRKILEANSKGTEAT